MSAYLTLDSEKSKRPSTAESAERRFLVSRRTKAATALPTPPAEVAVIAGKPPRRATDRDEKLAQKLA